MSDHKQILQRAVAFFSLTALGVGAYLWLTRADESTRARGPREQGQPVRVIVVEQAAAVPRVVGYGEVAAARSWQGLAEVSGTVIEIHADAQVGRVVREGTVLFELDPEELELEKQRTVAGAKGVRAQISEIKTRESSAKASLEVEQKVLSLAKKELERSESLYRQGTASLSEVEAAEFAVLSAQKAVVSLQNTLAELPASRRVLQAQLEEVNAGVTGAELGLARTKVIAPFTMRISELAVTTGQSVTSGQALVVGDGLDVFEVTARLPIGGIDPLLPERPTRQRPPTSQSEPAPGQDASSEAAEPEAAEPEGPSSNDPTKGPEPASARARPRGWFDSIAELVTPSVRLRMAGVDAAWPARFSRFAGVDPLTRTTGVVVELDRSSRRAGTRDVRLSPGMHVSVEFVGKARPGCLALPIEALHDGVVYVVGAKDQLELRAVEIDWAQEEFACVRSGVAAGERVIIGDLTPAVDGMRVAPSEDEFETERLRALLVGPEDRS